MRRKDELDSVNERRGSLGTKSPNSVSDLNFFEEIFVHYLPEPGTKTRANERSKGKSERKSGYSGNQNQVQFTCYRLPLPR